MISTTTKMPRKSSRSRDVYCGNNRYEVKGKNLGSPHQCMQKGIGVGLHMDLSGFNPKYESIVADTTYCGSGSPPKRRQKKGSRVQCLQKGIGVGKRLQYKHKHPRSRIRVSRGGLKRSSRRRRYRFESDMVERVEWTPIVLSILVVTILYLILMQKYERWLSILIALVCGVGFFLVFVVFRNRY
jgi:hypothetical protein